MRLTHIKLAGFKSFVDPTTIPTPGKLVGIVGPNGCGKSNVIDAVRWVLGESSARHLRGESMQDVIFNGSGERKPVSRASVELTFDNSLGRAGGAWNQYAEITVKRVLTRDGDSQYFVNNLKVRRRDVTDIFLGTGLGPRAYAIIEQGMISRIIESRPEELRVFLEEAAGVSKYKERRRETELRLRDTRENLVRVDDVRQELDKQLARLESQAEVARQYRDLNKRLADSRNLLTYARRREAAAQRERHQREVQRLINELEGETARLRQLESQLEQAREAHFAASDNLHAVQGAMYEANAEVARIEQSIRHHQESRERLQSQLAGLESQQAQQLRQRQEAEEGMAHWGSELDAARLRREEVRLALEEASLDLPGREAAHQEARERHAALLKELGQVEQEVAIEEANRTHALRARQQLDARRERLEREVAALPEPDTEALAELREAAAEQALILEETRLALDEAQARWPEIEAARRRAAEALQEQSRATAALEARLAALRQMQEQVASDAALETWLERHGLTARPRLWQRLNVESGWENALEGVLEARLNTLLMPGLAGGWDTDAPPAAVVLAEVGETVPVEAAGDALSARVRWQGRAELPAVLAEWLSGIRTVPDLAAALAARDSLPPGVWLVCPEGHLVSRHATRFFGAQAGLHGVLVREKEIAALEGELERATAALAELQTSQTRAEQDVTAAQARQAELRARLHEEQQQAHRQQVELHRLEQQAQHAADRRARLEGELAEVAEQQEIEREQAAESDYHLEELRERLESVGARLDEAREALEASETILAEQRTRLREVEREAQDAGFKEQLCENKINELKRNVQAISSNLEGLDIHLEDLRLALASQDDAPVREELQAALARRHAQEAALTQARDAMNEAGNRLRAAEEGRMQSEQALNPLREKLGNARLKEQEARINEERLAEQLRAAGAVEAEMDEGLKRATPAGLEREIAGLEQAIADLGAVNLAALEELQSERERKAFLDDQAADLTEAVETLEQAIRRIDRETRDLLQETYDTVNRHFGELFPSLFGGGQAQLLLTGDEILDAGLQIVAQPPGKRNSTIHLLSGGEKALTALSLTFSFFRLNPAPFCLLDEVDAPLDDSNTERFCRLVEKMAEHTQFLYISHNKITMEMADQLVGVTMQEQGASRVVAVDFEEALKLRETAGA